jgi:broad specificity phosphatase PhoE
MARDGPDTPMTSRLYLVRHGRPAAGWGEDDDPGLDETGHAQAKAVAERLLALGPADRPTRVASSPLRRCRETAQPLADALGVAVEIDPRVGEIPTPAGLAAAERPAWLREAMGGAWSQIKGDIDYLAWRGQVAAALVGRAGYAVFSHFVAINAVVSHIAGEPGVVLFRPDHTSTTILAIDGEALALVERGQEAATRVL